jgi:hypothetical protein
MESSGLLQGPYWHFCNPRAIRLRARSSRSPGRCGPAARTPTACIQVIRRGFHAGTARPANPPAACARPARPRRRPGLRAIRANSTVPASCSACVTGPVRLDRSRLTRCWRRAKPGVRGCQRRDARVSYHWSGGHGREAAAASGHRAGALWRDGERLASALPGGGAWGRPTRHGSGSPRPGLLLGLVFEVPSPGTPAADRRLCHFRTRRAPFAMQRVSIGVGHRSTP